MTELSHWPTDTPERRAASRAVSRAPGAMPFTCHGADLIRPPTFRLADRSRSTGPYPLTGRGGTPDGCPRSDFFRFRVNMRLRDVPAPRSRAKLWPPSHAKAWDTSVLNTAVVTWTGPNAGDSRSLRPAGRSASRPSSHSPGNRGTTNHAGLQGARR